MESPEVFAIWMGKQAGPELFDFLLDSTEDMALLAAVVPVYQLD